MPIGVILIAEDYKDNRDILKDIVAEEFPDIEVQAVEDGARAAEVIKEQIRVIRLLLTDFLMPELNGDAVIQVLKDEAQKAGIPVPPFLVLSATPDNVPTDLQPYLLPKPFNLSNLLTRIRKALQPQETHLNTTPTLSYATDTAAPSYLPSGHPAIPPDSSIDGHDDDSGRYKTIAPNNVETYLV